MPKGEARRQRIVWKPSQRQVLEAWFAKNPYPGIAAREQLAEEIGVPESRIQIWFWNQRKKCGKQQQARSVSCSEEEQPQCQECQQPGNQEYFPKEAPRKRTFINRSQNAILVAAFEQNQYPGITVRKELAKQTGLPEARIQIWFQNHRARHPGKNPRGSVNSFACAPNPRPHPTVGQEQNHLSRVPSSSTHPLSSNISSTE